MSIISNSSWYAIAIICGHYWDYSWLISHPNTLLYIQHASPTLFITETTADWPACQTLHYRDKSTDWPVWHSSLQRLQSTGQPAWHSSLKRLQSTGQPACHSSLKRLQSTGQPAWHSSLKRLQSTGQPACHSSLQRQVSWLASLTLITETTAYWPTSLKLFITETNELIGQLDTLDYNQLASQPDTLH